MDKDQAFIHPADVVGAAVRILEDHLPDPVLARAALAALERFGYGSQDEPGRLPPLTAIPGLVHSAARGDYAPALPLCGIALLLYAGIDRLDDLMDGEPITPEELLVAVTLTSAVPQLALAALDAPRETVVQMQGALARGLAEMAAGQHFDLASRAAPATSVADVERSVIMKSGGFTAMLAALGALLAGCDAGHVAAYAEWGRAYGAADQVRSDCTELLHDGPSEDLRNGTITHPIACLLEAAGTAEGPGLIDLIGDAARDLVAREHLRTRLRESGAFASSALFIDWQRTQGLRSLERADPMDPGRTALRDKLNATHMASALSTVPG